MRIKFSTGNTIRKLAYINESFFVSSSMPEIMKLYPMLYGKDFYRSTLAAHAIHRLGKDREAFYSAVVHDNQKQIESLKSKEAKKLVDRASIPMMSRHSGTFRSFKKSFIRTYKSAVLFEPVVHKIFDIDLPKTLVIVLTENIHGRLSCNMLYYNAGETAISLTINHRIKEEPALAIGVVLRTLIRNRILQGGFLKQKSGEASAFADALLDYFAPNGMLSEGMHLSGRKPISDYMKESATAYPGRAAISERLLPHMEEYYQRFASITVWNYLKMTEFADFLENR